AGPSDRGLEARTGGAALASTRERWNNLPPRKGFAASLQCTGSDLPSGCSHERRSLDPIIAAAKARDRPDSFPSQGADDPRAADHAARGPRSGPSPDRPAAELVRPVHEGVRPGRARDAGIAPRVPIVSVGPALRA